MRLTEILHHLSTCHSTLSLGVRGYKLCISKSKVIEVVQDFFHPPKKEKDFLYFWSFTFLPVTWSLSHASLKRILLPPFSGCGNRFPACQRCSAQLVLQYSHIYMHLAWWLLIQRLKSDKKNAYGQNIRQLLPADSLQFFTQAHRISVLLMEEILHHFQRPTLKASRS